MGEAFTVNSEQTKAAYHRQVDIWWEEDKYLTFPAPRKGVDRSLDQNALFHVWCTEWIAYKLGKHPKAVIKSELAGMKRTAKKIFLLAHPDCKEWMVHEIVDYSTGATKKDYTSSKDWLTGEMYMVLTFIQLCAAEDGLILESKGQFNKLQRENAK